MMNCSNRDHTPTMAVCKAAPLENGTSWFESTGKLYWSFHVLEQVLTLKRHEINVIIQK